MTKHLTQTKPILRYPGAKWFLANWIVEHLPPFRAYVEPYFGSGAVFFCLPHAPKYAMLNDKSRNVVNLFQVIRGRAPELCALLELSPWARDEYDASFSLTGDELEDARRFLVRCWQAHATRLNAKTGWRIRGSATGKSEYLIWNRLPDRIAAVVGRLKYAEIENREALEVIARFAGQEDCLLYIDPPYLMATRSGPMYEHEMGDSDHQALLDLLDKCAGPVILSGYSNPLYDERLAHWRSLSHPSVTQSGKIRSEMLWLNAQAVAQRPSLFEEGNREGGRLQK